MLLIFGSAITKERCLASTGTHESRLSKDWHIEPLAQCRRPHADVLESRKQRLLGSLLR